MAETEDGKKDVKKLAKNTGFLYLLSLSSQIVNLALIPFETRVLGSEAYGVIALSVAMSSIITIVLDFGLILSATERVVKLAGNAASLARLLSDVFYRGHADMRIITVRTVMVKVISALPIFFLLRGPSDMWVVPALLLAGNAAAVFFSYCDIRKRYRVEALTFDVKESFGILRASFGFFVSRFSSVFYQSMNSVLLGFVYPGQAVVGFYGAAEKFLSYAKVASSPVADSLYPYMVRTKNYRLCMKVLALAMPLILVAATFAWVYAEPICLFAFGEGYEGAAVLLRCLMPAIVVIFPTYVLCFPMLVPMGLSSYANRSNVIGAIVQVVLVGGLFATGAFGAATLCIAASISEVSVFLYRFWAVWSHRKLMPNGSH